jgi:hypothetical protein
LIGAKILRRPLSYWASVFSGTISWANVKQPEYCVSLPLGAETQKLSFHINPEATSLIVMKKTGTRHHFYLVVHKNTFSLHLKFNNDLSKNQDEREGDLWYKNNDLLF